MDVSPGSTAQPDDQFFDRLLNEVGMLGETIASYAHPNNPKKARKVTKGIVENFQFIANLVRDGKRSKAIDLVEMLGDGVVEEIAQSFGEEVVPENQDDLLPLEYRYLFEGVDLDGDMVYEFMDRVNAIASVIPPEEFRLIALDALPKVLEQVGLGAFSDVMAVLEDPERLSLLFAILKEKELVARADFHLKDPNGQLKDLVEETSNEFAYVMRVMEEAEAEAAKGRSRGNQPRLTLLQLGIMLLLFFITTTSALEPLTITSLGLAAKGVVGAAAAAVSWPAIGTAVVLGAAGLSVYQTFQSSETSTLANKANEFETMSNASAIVVDKYSLSANDSHFLVLHPNGFTYVPVTKQNSEFLSAMRKLNAETQGRPVLVTGIFPELDKEKPKVILFTNLNRDVHPHPDNLNQTAREMVLASPFVKMLDFIGEGGPVHDKAKGDLDSMTKHLKNEIQGAENRTATAEQSAKDSMDLKYKEPFEYLKGNRTVELDSGHQQIQNSTAQAYKDSLSSYKLEQQKAMNETIAEFENKKKQLKDKQAQEEASKREYIIQEFSKHQKRLRDANSTNSTTAITKNEEQKNEALKKINETEFATYQLVASSLQNTTFTEGVSWSEQVWRAIGWSSPHMNRVRALHDAATVYQETVKRKQAEAADRFTFMLNEVLEGIAKRTSELLLALEQRQNSTIAGAVQNITETYGGLLTVLDIEKNVTVVALAQNQTAEFSKYNQTVFQESQVNETTRLWDLLITTFNKYNGLEDSLNEEKKQEIARLKDEITKNATEVITQAESQIKKIGSMGSLVSRIFRFPYGVAKEYPQVLLQKLTADFGLSHSEFPWSQNEKIQAEILSNETRKTKELEKLWPVVEEVHKAFTNATIKDELANTYTGSLMNYRKVFDIRVAAVMNDLLSHEKQRLFRTEGGQTLIPGEDIEPTSALFYTAVGRCYASLFEKTGWHAIRIKQESDQIKTLQDILEKVDVSGLKNLMGEKFENDVVMVNRINDCFKAAFNKIPDLLEKAYVTVYDALSNQKFLQALLVVMAVKLFKCVLRYRRRREIDLTNTKFTWMRDATILEDAFSTSVLQQRTNAFNRERKMAIRWREGAVANAAYTIPPLLTQTAVTLFFYGLAEVMAKGSSEVLQATGIASGSLITTEMLQFMASERGGLMTDLARNFMPESRPWFVKSGPGPYHLEGHRVIVPHNIQRIYMRPATRDLVNLMFMNSFSSEVIRKKLLGLYIHGRDSIADSQPHVPFAILDPNFSRSQCDKALYNLFVGNTPEHTMKEEDDVLHCLDEIVEDMMTPGSKEDHLMQRLLAWHDDALLHDNRDIVDAFSSFVESMIRSLKNSPLFAKVIGNYVEFLDNNQRKNLLSFQLVSGVVKSKDDKSDTPEEGARVEDKHFPRTIEVDYTALKLDNQINAFRYLVRTIGKGVYPILEALTKKSVLSGTDHRSFVCAKTLIYDCKRFLMYLSCLTAGVQLGERMRAKANGQPYDFGEDQRIYFSGVIKNPASGKTAIYEKYTNQHEAFRRRIENEVVTKFENNAKNHLIAFEKLNASEARLLSYTNVSMHHFIMEEFDKSKDDSETGATADAAYYWDLRWMFALNCIFASFEEGEYAQKKYVVNSRAHFAANNLFKFSKENTFFSFLEKVILPARVKTYIKLSLQK